MELVDVPYWDQLLAGRGIEYAKFHCPNENDVIGQAARPMPSSPFSSLSRSG